MIQNLLFGIAFLKFYFGHTTFSDEYIVHTLQSTSSEFFFISDFPAESLKTNKT